MESKTFAAPGVLRRQRRADLLVSLTLAIGITAYSYWLAQDDARVYYQYESHWAFRLLYLAATGFFWLIASGVFSVLFSPGPNKEGEAIGFSILAGYVGIVGSLVLWALVFYAVARAVARLTRSPYVLLRHAPTVVFLGVLTAALLFFRTDQQVLASCLAATVEEDPFVCIGDIFEHELDKPNPDVARLWNLCLDQPNLPHSFQGEDWSPDVDSVTRAVLDDVTIREVCVYAFAGTATRVAVPPDEFARKYHLPVRGPSAEELALYQTEHGVYGLGGDPLTGAYRDVAFCEEFGGRAGSPGQTGRCLRYHLYTYAGDRGEEIVTVYCSAFRGEQPPRCRGETPDKASEDNGDNFSKYEGE